MSEWTPRVGDRVMVGEHGPYLVTNVAVAAKAAHLNTAITAATWVPFDWLSPAPEPEPEEPTAPGALVRDGHEELWCFNPAKARGPKSPDWDLVGQDISRDWARIPRPITVVLADPAEVEQLRAERDAYRKAKQENDERFQVEAARQRERADQLQNELDYIYRRLSEGPAVRTYEAEVRWREWVAASISRRGEL